MQVSQSLGRLCNTQPLGPLSFAGALQTRTSEKPLLSMSLCRAETKNSAFVQAEIKAAAASLNEDAQRLCCTADFFFSI